jgi:hypothetical protein
VPHPPGRSPHQLRKKKRTATGHYTAVENTLPRQPDVELHIFMPENGKAMTIAQVGEVTGAPNQYACLVVYTDPAEAREARARFERAATRG